jgi:hypothetical protein
MTLARNAQTQHTHTLRGAASRTYMLGVHAEAAEENSAETPPPCTITHSSIKNGRRAGMIQGLMLKYHQIHHASLSILQPSLKE